MYYVLNIISYQIQKEINIDNTKKKHTEIL